MITSYHGGNTYLSNFPFRTPFLGLGGGGERISKGSGLCIYALLVLFCASPFYDVQWLAGSPSIKLLYFTAYFFKIWTHFVIKIFCGFA